MTTRHRLVSVLALLTLAVLAVSARAADPKKKPAAKKKPAPAKKKPAPAAKEAGEISLRALKREVADLTRKQEEKISDLWAKRDQALAEWDASPQGAQLTRAQEQVALEGNRSASMQVKLLSRNRAKVGDQYDAKILAVLTPAQRATWKGFLIYKEVTDMLRQKGVSLTPAQAAESRELCNAAAKKRPTASVMSLRGPVAQAIYSRVLTGEQKKKVNPAYKDPKKKPAAAAKKNNNKNKKNNRKKNNNKKKKGNNNGGMLGGGGMKL